MRIVGKRKGSTSHMSKNEIKTLCGDNCQGFLSKRFLFIRYVNCKECLAIYSRENSLENK